MIKYTLAVILNFPMGTTREEVERARHSLGCEAEDFKIINSADVFNEIIEHEVDEQGHTVPPKALGLSQ